MLTGETFLESELDEAALAAAAAAALKREEAMKISISHFEILIRIRGGAQIMHIGVKRRLTFHI